METMINNSFFGGIIPPSFALDRQAALLLLVAYLVSPCLAEVSSGPSQQFLSENCFRCHSEETHEGALNLETLGTDLQNPELLSIWTRVHDRVANREMPPKSESRPSKVQTQKFLSELSDDLNHADLIHRRTTLRRLNRVEYENTVCDLFGINISLKDLLPEDSETAGFDTVGDGLGISTEHLLGYLQASDQLVTKILEPDPKAPHISVRIPFSQEPALSPQMGKLFLKLDDQSLVIFQGQTHGSVFLSGRAKTDGTYRCRIQAKTYQSKRPLVMQVQAGDTLASRISRLVGYFDVVPSEDWTVIEFESFLKKNDYISFDAYRLRATGKGGEVFKGPGLMIGEISIEGPLETWPPDARTKLIGDTDLQNGTTDDARAILTRLLPRAFRRRTTPGEVEPFLELTENSLKSGRSFIEALSMGLQAILCAPEFLLREEQSLEQPLSQPRVISPEAFASRIAYFLWSSMPDDQLLSLAADGKLDQAEVLHTEVERILQDPKSDRFIENFTGQWLGLRSFSATEPDAKLFPEFDEMLRFYLVEETRAFFAEILDHDLSLLEFIDSNWAMLNSRLALHYKLDGVFGQQIRRVTLPPGNIRGGVLTQGSVLKVLANGTSTSPVVRGNWILNNIVGKPTPPPPSDVPAIDTDIRGASTILEQLEKHRNVESCATCHVRIDPPGIALENFDPIGGYRRYYRSLTVGEPVKLEINGSRVQFRNGRLVKSSVKTPDHRTITDVRDLKKMLLEDKKQIATCLTEKLLVYGLGRQLGFSDRAAVQEIVAKVERRGYGFRTLIHEVIRSPLFRKK
jgi:hypothetical protein